MLEQKSVVFVMGGIALAGATELVRQLIARARSGGGPGICDTVDLAGPDQTSGPHPYFDERGPAGSNMAIRLVTKPC